jgi:NAD(P)H-dependent flavin oxidoreductase YrpB (nitropropane dioxygenase family)
MGVLSPPALVAAVSEAGGLGMLGTARPGARSLARLEALLEEVHSLTSRPFGVNFLASPHHLPVYEPGSFRCAARSARVVEFFYGRPDPSIVEIVHAEGALCSWQVGSREEAEAAAEAGCDLVIAQGVEAGGHVRGTIGMLPLLVEVVEAVDVPVLAAGGIGTGRAMAAALAAGASGVRVGTRFLASPESDAHPEYVERLIAARAEDTVYTTAFSGGWPDAPHRVLRSCLEAAEAFPDDIVGERSSLDGKRVPIKRFDAASVPRDATGAIGAMSLWAGESVGGVTKVQPAAEVVQEMAAEAEALLRRW